MPPRTIVGNLEDQPRVIAPRVQSRFPRLPPIRAGLAAKPSEHGEHYVYSEEGLLRALAEVSNRFRFDAAGTPSALGGSIVIAAPFTVKATVVIPPRCTGLTIRGLPGATLLPNAADQGVLFNLQAQLVTIRDLFAFYKAEGGTPTAWFNVFVEASLGAPVDGVIIGPSMCRIRDCVVLADKLYVDTTTDDAAETIVADNWCNEANATHEAAIHFNSGRMIARGNVVQDGGSNSVTVGSDGESCKIVENELGYGGVDTASSLGSNVVWGNTRTGALTLHGTDASGGNT